MVLEISPQVPPDAISVHRQISLKDFSTCAQDVSEPDERDHSATSWLLWLPPHPNLSDTVATLLLPIQQPNKFSHSHQSIKVLPHTEDTHVVPLHKSPQVDI